METLSNEEYKKYIKLLEHHKKQQERVKLYKQNHKNDPKYIEYNRRNAKKHYENHKEEYHQKYLIRKQKKQMENEIKNLKNISV